MDWLSARAHATPDKTFLYTGEDELSFAEVDRLVAAAAAFLQAHYQVEAGDKVAILLPNGLPFVLCLLALMRIRAIAVPLNTRLTARELKWQYEHTTSRLLICQPETAKLARDITADVLKWPDALDTTTVTKDAATGESALDTDLAIIHTSGTSGRPKAAVLTWGNFYHSALSSAFRLGVLPHDRWLCTLPLYHVGGLSIILRSLLYGTAVELLPSASFDVETTNRVLSEKPVTLVSLVPTMLQRLLDAREGAWHPQLRLILLGGEAPSPTLLQRCEREGIPLAASYGLSEAASQVATALPTSLREKPGSVGKPLMFTQVRIVDADAKDVAAHTAGEILVKGPTVMRAYFNDAAATAAALRDGWLHTGDIGYRDGDGDLFVLQRRSDLIISGGENVYPAEVEPVLRDHPAVAEAIVFGLPDARWGQSVGAVIELADGMAATADDISTFARSRLAGYKVPRRIVFVDALPRTGSGKIQRRDARKAFDDAISRGD